MLGFVTICSVLILNYTLDVLCTLHLLFSILRYPIYQHSENWIAEWIGNAETNSGFWKFSDENNILGTMFERALTGSIYPLTKQNWRYFDINFNVENINELPIFCMQTATPTRLPSFCNIYCR